MVVTTAVNFPSDPDTDPGINGEWTSDEGVTYRWDGVAWNIVSSDGAADIDLSGDVEIGTDCDTKLTVHSTADFECALTVSGDDVALDKDLQVLAEELKDAVINGGGIEEAPVDGELYGRQDKKWLVIPAGGVGGGDVHMSPCGEEPVNVAEGTLWYQTDELNLKIKLGDTWVPVINRLDAEGLKLSGGNLTGKLLVEDQGTQGNDDAIVFEVKTVDSQDPDRQRGGFIVTQNGDVAAIGTSEIPQSPRSFVTKEYLDDTIEETIALGEGASAKYVSKQETDVQEMVGDLVIKDEDSAAGSRISPENSQGIQFRLGNAAEVDKNGHAFGRENYLSDAYNIELENKDEYKDSDGTLKGVESQRITQRIRDRITLREDMQCNVRAESRSRGTELDPPANFDGKKFTVYREVRWSDDELHVGGSGEGPKQLLQWVARPDDSAYNSLATQNVKAAPFHTRAATAGWVSDQIVENLLAKGSDLCADSADGAVPGGFWRDTDGRVYIKTA
jgi:hypothetical protein